MEAKTYWSQGDHYRQVPLSHTNTHVHTMNPGAEVDRIKKNYLESQSRRTSHLRGLSDELQGVQKIMFENIDAVC